jgi:hypothetical protein
MPRKIETLYTRCCKAELDEETGTCTKCRQFEPDPITESELETGQEYEYLD